MTVSLTANQISLFLVVLARVGGLIVSAPVVGDVEVPRRVKAILALMLTLVLMQLPGLMRSTVPAGLADFALLIVVQLLFGVTLGFVARLLFFAVQTAGEIVSLQTGLSIASIFNPLRACRGISD